MTSDDPSHWHHNCFPGFLMQLPWSIPEIDKSYLDYSTIDYSQ